VIYIKGMAKAAVRVDDKDMEITVADGIDPVYDEAAERGYV
jgi:hypothetical protein